jgi:hypothetical protein
MERLGSDKHSGLFGFFVSDEEKKFYIILTSGEQYSTNSFSYQVQEPTFFICNQIALWPVACITNIF